MTPELLDALRATQEQALCYSVTVCHSRDVELLADALEIAELERMAGL